LLHWEAILLWYTKEITEFRRILKDKTLAPRKTLPKTGTNSLDAMPSSKKKKAQPKNNSELLKSNEIWGDISSKAFLSSSETLFS